jgi:hypothetical protein
MGRSDGCRHHSAQRDGQAGLSSRRILHHSLRPPGRGASHRRSISCNLSVARQPKKAATQLFTLGIFDSSGTQRVLPRDEKFLRIMSKAGARAKTTPLPCIVADPNLCSHHSHLLIRREWQGSPGRGPGTVKRSESKLGRMEIAVLAPQTCWRL